MWSYLKRNYLPGRTGTPKMFMATLGIPDDAFHGLSAAFTAQLTRRYAEIDKKLFQYTIAASNHYLLLWDTDNSDSILFLTDRTISDQYTEFRKVRLVEDFEELDRYHSPELTIDQRPDRRALISYGELISKIELNKAFRGELKYQIRALIWSQFTAFKFNIGYIPAHYIARITPLRFVDIPKIRTVTSFGKRVVLANSSYTYTTSIIRIWVYEKIIELLEVRLRYYNELAKGLSEINSAAAGTTENFFLPWYSEDITGYWDIAGLPHVVSGTFFSPRLDPMQTRRPAVISFVRPETESEKPELLGWYLSIGETVSSARADTSSSIFIDPLKSPRAVYARKGKTPGEKRLQLDCTIYINPGMNSPFEQDIIDRVLKPFINVNDRGIEARIIFDGHTFEIRQHPAQHGNSLIFWGKL
jgi:hypothetical protein